MGNVAHRKSSISVSKIKKKRRINSKRKKTTTTTTIGI